MLAKRIIPCLDVKEGKVVKGVQFNDHRIVGDILALATRYCKSQADEIVFYDITASCDNRTVCRNWVRAVAALLDIPFCVAGGINTIADAEAILNAGADKISINSPALINPNIIDEFAAVFGSQCVVIGIDSFEKENDYHVYQFTGKKQTTRNTGRKTSEWIAEVQERGAGEIVLNCMNQDGQRVGYDIDQLSMMRKKCHIPLIASGGAGSMADFLHVFQQTEVEGALAASVFHSGSIHIEMLKQFLLENKIEVRQ